MLTTCCNAINLAQVPSTIYETEIMEATHHQMHPHWTLLENQWVCHLLLTSYCHLLLTSYWHLIALFLFLCLQPMWSNASRLSPVFASGQEQANCSTWFWLMWYLLGLATAPFQPISFPLSGVCSPSYQVWTVKRLLEKIRPRCPTIFWKTHRMQASLPASYCFPRIELQHVSKELQRDKESVPSVP